MAAASSGVSRGSKLTVSTLKSLPSRSRHVEHGTHQPVEHLVAEHRTAVVGQHQDDRLVVEIVAQLDGAAGFVAELGVERHLLVETLVEADAAQRRRQLTSARAAALAANRRTKTIDSRLISYPRSAWVRTFRRSASRPLPDGTQSVPMGVPTRSVGTRVGVSWFIPSKHAAGVGCPGIDQAILPFRLFARRLFLAYGQLARQIVHRPVDRNVDVAVFRGRVAA